MITNPEPTGLMLRSLQALLIGAQDAATLAKAMHRCPAMTRAAIKLLRQTGYVMVSDTYIIGRNTRVRYTLTRKGLTAAKESLL